MTHANNCASWYLSSITRQPYDCNCEARLLPKENGCICDICADEGVECTNTAQPNEDQCKECKRGLHQKMRKTLRGLPGNYVAHEEGDSRTRW